MSCRSSRGSCNCKINLFPFVQGKANAIISSHRSINISNPGNPSEEPKNQPSTGSQVRELAVCWTHISVTFLFLCCRCLFFSCFQIDDIFGGAAVNGKENGSAAPASQPNRVRGECNASFRPSPAPSLCTIFCASADVTDTGRETAFGEGAGAGSQIEEPAAISTTGSQTICRLQHPGDARTLTGLTHTRFRDKSYLVLCYRRKI